VSLTAPDASWRRVFDPCTPLLFDLFHYLEQNGYFWLVPEHATGPSSQVLPGYQVRHPCYSRKLFVRICESIVVKTSKCRDKCLKFACLYYCWIDLCDTTWATTRIVSTFACFYYCRLGLCAVVKTRDTTHISSSIKLSHDPYIRTYAMWKMTHNYSNIQSRNVSHTKTHTLKRIQTWYQVALVSRILKIVGLFCKRAL